MESLFAPLLRQHGVTQAELSLMTGVPQPRISAYLHGRVNLSPDMLGYLLSALGHVVTVTVTTAPADLNRSDRRSWLLHRALATALDTTRYEAWRPRIEASITQLRTIVHGEPHDTNLARWEGLVRDGDIRALKRVLLDVGPDGVAMRDVSPMAGLLTAAERTRALEGQLP